MSNYCTWEEIKSIYKFEYFALGLIPYNKKNLTTPIPCPDFCHSYHISFDILRLYESQYAPIQKKLDQLNDWENEIKGKKSDSIPFTIRSEQDLTLMDFCLDISCNYNDVVNLTLENIKKLKAVLERSKDIYDEHRNKISEITANDPDANFWEYFQMPDSEDAVDELHTLLNEAVFEKDAVDKIKKIISFRFQVDDAIHHENDNLSLTQKKNGQDNERSHVGELETDRHRTDFSVKSQNGKNAESANHKKIGALPKIIDTFPELNLDHLKRITGGWVTKYHRQGVIFSRIVLYRKVSEYFGSEVSVKYAIVFEMPHYEPAPRPDAADTEKHIKWLTTPSSNPEDPYDSFIYGDLGYDSDLSQGLPKIMDINNFGVVYNPPLREGFEMEWKLIPLYKGRTLSDQSTVDEGGVVLYEDHSLCNSLQIMKRKIESEERILFDFFLKPIGEDYDIVCPGSKTLQYEYFSEPINIITPEDLESIQRQIMGFCMWLKPFPKGSLRSNSHPYYFIQDVVSFLKQNKKYFPHKGSKDLNAYLENLKIKLQEFINDIYFKKRLPLLLEALAQEAELMGISIDETGIEIESTDEKLEQTPKNNDPQPWSFKSMLAVWDVTFNGENKFLKKCMPIKYILEVLRQPYGKPINCFDLWQLFGEPPSDNNILSESNETPSDDNISPDREGLNLVENSPNIKILYQDKEILKDALRIKYEEYLLDMVGKKDEWDKLKKFAEEDGILTQENGESLSFNDSNWCKNNENDLNYVKAVKAVSKNKTRFLAAIRDCKALHEHFQTYLKIENGEITYAPPENSPDWQIID